MIEIHRMPTWHFNRTLSVDVKIPEWVVAQAMTTDAGRNLKMSTERVRDTLSLAGEYLSA